MLSQGDVVGQYEVEEIAGAGGMGVVYRARDLRLGRRVALKLIAPHLARDRVMRERLNRESTIVAGIDHPNVIPLYDAGETEDGALYLASRWVDGRELGVLVAEDGPLAPERAVRLVGQVAAALEAAHREGLVHRDVKPSNVLVTEGDHVYLTDFGIARRGTDATGLTETAQLLGTLDYVSPEQIQGERVDQRADVYALGGLLHHALTGEAPFPREGHAAKLYAHISADPPRPSTLRAELPATFDAVVQRALAKDPAERQHSAGAFEVEVHNALAEAPWVLGETRARRSGRFDREPVDSDAPADRDVVPPDVAALTVAGVEAPAKRRWPARAHEPAAGDAGSAGSVALQAEDFVAERHLDDVAMRAARSAAAPRARDVAPQAGRSGPDDRRPAARPRRLRRALVALAVVAAALVPAALLLGLVREERAGAQTASVAPRANGVVVVGGRVWVGVPGSSQLLGIATDDLTGAARRLELDAPVAAVAARGNRLLVGAERSLLDLPGASSAKARRLTVPLTPRLLAASAGTSWAAAGGDARELFRIRGKQAERKTMSSPADGLATGAGALWITHAEAGRLGRTDAKSGRFLSLTRLGGRPTGVAATADAVWVTDPERDVVLRIDPATGRPVGAPIPVPGDPVAVAADSREVWVVRRGQDAVTKLDARTGRPLDEVGTARQPVAVALSDDAAWVVGRRGGLTRIPR